MNAKGNEQFEIVKDYIQGNWSTMKLRNDTIFYSGRSISASDSIYYWYFGMMTESGDSIAEFKYPMIHFKDGNVTNYGIVLTGGSEAILWGEGIDNRQPNPTDVPYRSVFYRVGFDGSVRSDLIWYECSDHPSRRMSDAASDSDGSPVFGYYCLEDAARRYIIKLKPDNTVSREGSVSIGDPSLDDPRIAVDHEGNYIINSNFGGKDSIWNTDRRRTTHVTKINRQGQILWNTMMPQIKREGRIYLDRFEMLRMSVTKNNDILCVGQVIIADSFYHPVTQEPFHWVSYNASFIARLAPDGKVKWRHLMAPYNSEGSALSNILFDIQEAPDGSIIVAGQLQRDTSGFIHDAWLMRLSPDGCLNDSCDHIQKYWRFPDTISLTENIQLFPLMIYPNPGQQGFRILYSSDMIYPLQYELINSTGVRLQTGFLGSNDDEVDTSWLYSGAYQVLVRDRNGKVFSGRWVKMD
ncbi:MAG: T9SS type A sorting domain-containing protein [Saprospiraceae bacterium]|nr:T9SS type A sorting domain-containing protein [Saprospiraceae bacterium]